MRRLQDVYNDIVNAPLVEMSTLATKGSISKFLKGEIIYVHGHDHTDGVDASKNPHLHYECKKQLHDKPNLQWHVKVQLKDIYKLTICEVVCKPGKNFKIFLICYDL